MLSTTSVGVVIDASRSTVEAGGDARVVDERMGKTLRGGPPRRIAHAREVFLGHADAAVEVHERVATAAGGDELGHLGAEVLSLRLRLECKRRLEQREPSIGRPSAAAHSARIAPDEKP